MEILNFKLKIVFVIFLDLCNKMVLLLKMILVCFGFIFCIMLIIFGIVFKIFGIILLIGNNFGVFVIRIIIIFLVW